MGTTVSTKYDTITFSLGSLQDDKFVKKNINDVDMLSQIEAIVDQKQYTEHQYQKIFNRSNEGGLFPFITGMVIENTKGNDYVLRARQWYKRSLKWCEGKNKKVELLQKCVNDRMNKLEMKKTLYDDQSSLRAIINNANEYNRLEHHVVVNSVTKKDLNELRRDLQAIIIEEELQIASVLYNLILLGKNIYEQSD